MSAIFFLFCGRLAATNLKGSEWDLLVSETILFAPKACPETTVSLREDFRKRNKKDQPPQKTGGLKLTADDGAEQHNMGLMLRSAHTPSNRRNHAHP